MPQRPHTDDTANERAGSVPEPQDDDLEMAEDDEDFEDDDDLDDDSETEEDVDEG